MVEVGGCSWHGDVRVPCEGFGCLVQEGEALVLLPEPGVASRLLLEGQGGELGVDRAGRSAGGCGELDDGGVVAGEGGDVGLAHQHVGGHARIAGALRPFGGAARPRRGGVQVAAVLEEPAGHFAVLGQDLEQRVGVRRSGAGAQSVEHVDLREDGADEPAGAEHLVGVVELVQGAAEVAEDLVVDPGGLLQRPGGPLRVVGGAGQGERGGQCPGGEDLGELSA